MSRGRKKPDWVTDAVITEAEAVLQERVVALAATDHQELRRRVGHTLVTETIGPPGRRFADESLYVEEDGTVRAFVEIFADDRRHGWSKALAKGEHAPGLPP